MPSDDELVRTVQGGRREAFLELVNRHEAALYAYAWSRLHSDADAVQTTHDAFVEAYLSLDRYALGADFGAWLRGICRNLIRHHYRSQSRRRETELVEACLEIEDPAPPPELPMDVLRACLEKLDTVERRVVEGFYRDSRSLASIAALVHKSVSAVGVTLHRARYRLRDCLKQAGWGTAP